MAKNEITENQIPIVATGADQKTMEADLETRLKDAKKKLGSIGKQVDANVEVKFYLESPDKGAISGSGKDFDEAYKNATENSPIVISDAYQMIVTGNFTYELSKKEVEKAKTSGQGTTAGPKFDEDRTEYTFG